MDFPRSPKEWLEGYSKLSNSPGGYPAAFSTYTIDEDGDLIQGELQEASHGPTTPEEVVNLRESDSEYEPRELKSFLRGDLAGKRKHEEKTSSSQPCGSSAGIRTAFLYRVLFTKEVKGIPLWSNHKLFCNEALRKNVETLLDRSPPSQHNNDENNIPNFKLLLDMVGKSGERFEFPTAADETKVRRTPSLAYFSDFVHTLQQIQNISSEKSAPLTGNPPSDRELRPRVKITQLGLSTQLLTPLPRLRMSSKAPNKTRKMLQQEVEASPLLRVTSRRHPPSTSQPEGASISEVEAEATDMLSGMNRLEITKEKTPELRLATGGETVVIWTGLSLLTQIWLAYPIPEHTFEVSPANLAFTFQRSAPPTEQQAKKTGGKKKEEIARDQKPEKLWEARVDALLILTRAGMSANSIDEKIENCRAIIEAKNKKRSDTVRFQEIAEVVAMIRNQSSKLNSTSSSMLPPPLPSTTKSKSTSASASASASKLTLKPTTHPPKTDLPKGERWSYVVGISGDSYTITIAQWDLDYEKELEKLANISQQSAQEGDISPQDIQDFLSPSRFLYLTELPPFAIRRKQDLRQFVLTLLYLQRYEL